MLGVTDQDVLADELRPELAALGRVAAHRQRTFVLIADPTSSLRRPEICLHGRWAGSKLIVK